MSKIASYHPPVKVLMDLRFGGRCRERIPRLLSGVIVGEEVEMPAGRPTLELDPFEVKLIRAYLLAQGPDAVAVPTGLAQRLLKQRDDGSLGYMGAVVVLLGLGRPDVAAPRLRAFVERCESNPSEWGVTLRWEIAKAKELLRTIGGGNT
jgi:hypothetical protein